MQIAKRRHAAKLVTSALGLASAGAILGGGVAAADPPAGVTPRTTDIVGVGSDTTQFVMDAYATAYNKTNPARKLYSWDAVKPGTNPPVTGDPIKTKAGCATIARPNGSTAGIAALQASLAAGNHCIDFARSSAPKASTGQSNLAFFAFARDGVTWAAKPSNHTPSSLTPAQLAQIYTCQVTNWHSISASLPSNTIAPFLPQAGSGTRKFFEAAIGISDTQVGSCVNQSIEENDGRPLAGNLNAIAPYSIARWINQTPKGSGGTGGEADIRGGVTLRSINGTSPTVRNAKTHKITLNRKFTPTFLRLVYNVVGKGATGTVDPAYIALFGSHRFLCTHQSVAAQKGFGTLGAACGARS
jgi:ABC-type phosphate transport system substrate-binding protein